MLSFFIIMSMDEGPSPARLESAAIDRYVVEVDAN